MAIPVVELQLSLGALLVSNSEAGSHARPKKGLTVLPLWSECVRLVLRLTSTILDLDLDISCYRSTVCFIEKGTTGVRSPAEGIQIEFGFRQFEV